MSSEHLASAQNELKGNLGGAWNILDGAQGQYQDLGIARRFGGSAAAYSLRDIGAMNGRVVKVRRDLAGEEADAEEDFSASQVQSGTLENWVNGKLESTLPADVATSAGAYSLRKVSSLKTIYNQSSFPNTDVSPLVKNMTYNSFAGNVDGYQGKDNLIKLEMDASDGAGGPDISRTPQVALGLSGYRSSRTGTVTFEYYIESDSPLVGGYWIVGNETNQYSPEGVKIIGGAWTTAVVQFKDKTGSSTNTVYSDQGRLLSIRDASVGGQAIRINRDDTNPFIHFSSFLVTATDFSLVRIRRSSDNIEVNVGFDEDEKVSLNSLVGNVNEEGGDIGATNDTTLGDFISGTDAFVHTWFDQAGSNDAVQATSANQPKIAENGALLADGLDFDGSNDFLESTTLSSIYTGTDTVSSAFILVNSDAASTTQYIIGAGSTSASNPMYNTLFHSGGNVGWQARDDAGTLKSNLSATPYVANQMYLVSNINSGTTTDFNSNAVIIDNGADSDVGAKTINTVKLGARGNGSSSPLNGSIKEAIFYASDQSNNRFRIESNINNYYSLYNDELFFNGNVVPFTTASTITKSDGSTQIAGSGVVVSTGLKNSVKYTISGETTTGSRFTQFRLSDLGVNTVYPMANGEFIYFSATVESDTSDGLDFIIDIRDGFAALTNNSQHADARGTISGRLTRNSTAGDSGGDTCIMIQTSGVANATVHLSNIKLSQIERNGFVPTWYDQSGNFRPLIQTNASEQPIIVENGSFLGAIKAEVATSNDTMQNLQVSTDGTNPNFGTDDWADGGTKLGLMYVGSVISSVSPSNTAVLWGGGRGVSSFQSGGLSIQFIKAGADSFRLRNERQGLTPDGSTVALSGEVTGDAVIYGTADNRDFKIKVNDNSATDTEAADLDVREAAPLSLFGAYGGDNTRFYERSSSGTCKECYLFSGDNITEVDTIATEINNHYNIY